jgi:hypothetical protein
MPSRKSTLLSTLRGVTAAENKVAAARRRVQTQLSRDLLSYVKLENQLKQMRQTLEYSIGYLNADQASNIAPLDDLLARTRRDILRKQDEKRDFHQRAPTDEERAIATAADQGWVVNGFLSTSGIEKYREMCRSEIVFTGFDRALYDYLRSF